jgi:hypothetical protein
MKKEWTLLFHNYLVDVKGFWKFPM